MSKIKAWVTTQKGNQFEIDLPAKRIVCPTCNGSGTHVNRNIDGNGITGSEMAEIVNDDPDFIEDYMSGVYDVACEECNGRNVVDEVDVDALSPKMRDRYYRAIDEQQQLEAEIAAERRMGA